jgi:hypothetical protein
MEILGDTQSPWRRAQREAELQTANEVFEQSHRAESDFRMWNQDDITVWQQEWRSRRKRERQQEEQ